MRGVVISFQDMRFRKRAREIVDTWLELRVQKATEEEMREVTRGMIFEFSSTDKEILLDYVKAEMHGRKAFSRRKPELDKLLEV